MVKFINQLKQLIIINYNFQNSQLGRLQLNWAVNWARLISYGKNDPRKISTGQITTQLGKILK